MAESWAQSLTSRSLDSDEKHRSFGCAQDFGSGLKRPLNASTSLGMTTSDYDVRADGYH